MAARIDPRELKTLSDILALVLEDQPGGSEAALDALRRRARRDGTTGGALKNLFRQVASQNAGRPQDADSEQLRAALAALQRRQAETAMRLEREVRHTAQLREALRHMHDAHAAHEPDHVGASRLRMGDLERRILHTEDLRTQLGRAQAELTRSRAALVTSEHARAAEQAAHRARSRSWRIGLALAAALPLAADPAMTPVRFQAQAQVVPPRPACIPVHASGPGIAL